jgi:TM2 domain-containing membrane protein YozV
MSDGKDAARSQMLFEANRKSVGVAYLLWLFLGGLGGHRFYAGYTGSAVAQLLLSIFGWMTVWAMGLGFMLLVPLGIWLLVDAFLIPGWIRNKNTLLAMQLT